MLTADFLAVGHFVMKKYISGLAFAAIIGIASVLSSVAAKAAPYTSFEQLGSSAAAPENFVKQVGYYGDYYERDHYDRDKHGYDHDGGYYCGYTRYEKKYVCESTVPRCFKQRKCIWYYGREYCRYVRKCVGGDRYCKYVNVPIKDCGCRNCW
jgi:hypothetical protein